jgi:hypothetical protein
MAADDWDAMYPLLASAALSLAGKAIDAFTSHQATQTPAAAPADATSQPFSATLAATEKARLDTLSKSLASLPGVQSAVATHPGQPVQLSFSASGNLMVQAGNGPAAQVKVDANSAPLVTEARQLLSSLNANAITVN